MSPPIDHLNKFSGQILDASIAVHKEMGLGLLESVYHHCLLKEFYDRQLQVASMVAVPLHYRDEKLGKEYVIDLLVENEVSLNSRLWMGYSQYMTHKSSVI